MSRTASLLEAFLLADEGFVNLDNRTFAAHFSWLSGPECFSDAMTEEPSGFHRANKHTLDLTGRDALFGRTHQMDDLQPKMQGEMRGLEDGSHAHGERLAAFLAIVQAKPSGFALHLGNAVSIGVAAMRAVWAFRPQHAFDMCESGFLVVEMGGFKNGASHGKISYRRESTPSRLLCQ